MNIWMLLIVVHTVISISPNSEDKKVYRYWKAKYRKNYLNAREEKKAMDNFFRQKEDIDKHNRKYELGEVPFKRALWKKSDLTNEERERKLEGFVEPEYEFEDYEVEERAITTGIDSNYPPGPPSIDFNEQGFVTPIKDQGDCASCWAFSAIGALETVYAKKYKTLRNISEQNLLDCNRNAKTGSWGCVGGSQASAYMYIKFNNGISSTEGYPYQGNDVFNCRYNATNSIGTTTGYVRIPKGNETLLKDIVAEVGAVAFGMDASMESFGSYSSGVYFEPKCPQNLGHSATIIGYGHDDASGLDYWLVKNSWSNDWGMRGFFKIARGFNMCGLTNYLIYPRV